MMEQRVGAVLRGPSLLLIWSYTSGVHDAYLRAAKSLESLSRPIMSLQVPKSSNIQLFKEGYKVSSVKNL